MEKQVKESEFWGKVLMYYKWSIGLAAIVFFVSAKSTHGFGDLLGLLIASSLKAFVWPLFAIFG